MRKALAYPLLRTQFETATISQGFGDDNRASSPRRVMQSSEESMTQLVTVTKRQQSMSMPS